MSRSSRRRGFTLVELIVVSGMSTLLFGQLFTAIQDAREAARRSQCKNNLKQIGLALHNYHDVYGSLPMGWVGVDLEAHEPAVFGTNGWGWGGRILPFMDQAPLYNQVAFGERVDEGTNAKLLNKPIAQFRCPSDPYAKKTWMMKDEKGADVLELATANYAGSFGTGDVAKCQKLKVGEACMGDGIFYQNRGTKIADITDGTANTLAVGERVGTTKGDRFSTWSGVIAKGKDPLARILGSSDQILDAREHHAANYLSPHKGASHFLLMDGAVRFLKSDLDLKLFQALTTRAGGEELPDF